MASIPENPFLPPSPSSSNATIHSFPSRTPVGGSDTVQSSMDDIIKKEEVPKMNVKLEDIVDAKQDAKSAMLQDILAKVKVQDQSTSPGQPHKQNDLLKKLQEKGRAFLSKAPKKSVVEEQKPFKTESKPEVKDFSHKSPNLVQQTIEEDIRDAPVLEYEALEKEMNEKKKKGTFTDEDDIKLIRAKKAYEAEMRKQEEDEMLDGGLSEPEEENGDDEEQDVLFIPETTVTKGKKTGPRKRKAKEVDQDAEQPKKRSKAVKKAPKTPKVKKPTAAQLRKAAASERKDYIMGKHLKLGTGDVFASAQANQARDEQPTFTSTKRQTALKELIASLPEEQQQLAKVDKEAMGKALQKFTPDRSCFADGKGGWTVRGLKSSLSSYQMLGVSFMRSREIEGNPAGGILADEMGLGKTVTTIANIVNDNKRKKADKDNAKTTLIVVPPSLVNQWMSELVTHIDEKELGRIAKYCSKSRNIANIGELQKHDIVVTTYYEISSSFPHEKPPIELHSVEEQQEWIKNNFEENKGLFHSIKFRRIILDEAQIIKNQHSVVSQACQKMDAQFFWTLSGTPVMNTLSEFYPYFKFLRAPDASNFDLFAHNYNSTSKSTDRLLCMLRKMMIRRTHSDELLGAKLLPLKKPTKNDCSATFTHLEVAIYKVVRVRIIDRINAISRSGRLTKYRSHIFTMVLRLRQLTGHVLMIQDCMRDILQPEDFEKLDAIASKVVEAHQSESAQIKYFRQLLARGTNQEQLEPAPTDADNDTSVQVQEDDSVPEAHMNSHVNVGNGFGTRNNFKEYFENMQVEQKLFTEQLKALHCGFCNKDDADALELQPCHHVFCNDCLHRHANRGDAIHDRLVCPTCQVPYSSASRKEASVAPKPADVPGAEKPKKPKLKDIIAKWVDEDGHMIPSTKTLAAKAQLLEWMNESDQPKIIVYTHFLTMVKIMSKMCEIEGWTSQELIGTMSSNRRGKVIQKFLDPTGPRILISTIGCGGLGLNLTSASKVLLMDLWWNSASEQQAFCRVYRRGQEKETFLTRLVITNSMDAKILKLQERKNSEIDEVMGEEAAKKKITTKEMMELFGTVYKDKDGNLQIENDKDSEE